MWTPKRILILLATLTVLLTGFGVYAYFLGGIDGLPPLPPGYEWAGGGEELPLLPPPDPSDVDKRLANGFGTDCEEIRRRFKVDLRSRGWVFASDSFETKDGRVELRPFSACIFPKARADGKFPEINTVKCEVAYLTLDRAVTNHMELANRKVIGVELRGSASRDIIIRNNRQTVDPNDDIEVRIFQEPLFFDDAAGRIWSKGLVKLLDLRTQPKETEITGIGLELYLVKDGAAAGAKSDKKKAKSEGVSGLDKLILLSDVNMYLNIDGSSGFLGNDTPSQKPAGLDKKAEPAFVRIKTPGRFTYDLSKDKAIFESPRAPKNGPAPDPLAPEQVVVCREHPVPQGNPLFDQLDCNYLEIQFRRKESAKGTVREGQSEREIESAYATADPGNTVHLVMDTENIDAEGTELTFRAATDKAGSQTLLKGNPLRAMKDAHELIASDLLLIGEQKKGGGRQAHATGPGEMRLFDKSKSAYLLHATWKDKLSSTKVKEGDRLYDLLVLTKEACFVDDEHKQALHGDRLEVMLEPVGPEAAGPAEPAEPAEPTKQAAPGAPRQRPYKIDAFGNVRALSPEFNVKRADVLLVRFTNEVPVDERLPETMPPVASAPAAGGVPAKTVSIRKDLDRDKPLTLVPSLPEPKGEAARPSAPSAPSALPTPEGEPPAARASAAAVAEAPPAKARPPIELEARQITAIIKRGGSKDELHKLISEGNVHVHQEPEKADDKGVDIKGNLLELLHHPTKGDVLDVFGESNRFAELQLGELFLSGPKVTINQQYNTTEVHGAGGMSMPSNATFEGAKPAKEGTRLEVYWNDDMFFDGKTARFNGGIQARQDTAWMLCGNLQVELDRMMSFKQGQNKSERPKAEKIVCMMKVIVVDEVRDGKGGWQKYQGLSGTYLEVDNVVEQSMASGPGQIVLLGTGGAELTPTAPKMDPKGVPYAAPAITREPKEKQTMLTRIFYDGRVSTLSKQKVTRITQNVRVFHFPATHPKAQMNPDRPPKDGLYMKCDELKIYTRDLGDGKTSREFNAKDRVTFRAETFYGLSTWVKYDESTERIIFEGTDDNPAVLYRFVPGQPKPQQIKAKKILYNRKTGVFSGEGGREILGRLPESRQRLSLAVARLNANGEDDALARLILAARDDGQKLAAG